MDPLIWTLFGGYWYECPYCPPTPRGPDGRQGARRRFFNMETFYVDSSRVPAAFSNEPDLCWSYFTGSSGERHQRVCDGCRMTLHNRTIGTGLTDQDYWDALADVEDHPGDEPCLVRLRHAPDMMSLRPPPPDDSAYASSSGSSTVVPAPYEFQAEYSFVPSTTGEHFPGSFPFYRSDWTEPTMPHGHFFTDQGPARQDYWSDIPVGYNYHADTDDHRQWYQNMEAEANFE